MNGAAIFENVRRYRVIASLYRQTAAFCPNQKWSLLGQAKECGSAVRCSSWRIIFRAHRIPADK